MGAVEVVEPVVGVAWQHLYLRRWSGLCLEEARGRGKAVTRPWREGLWRWACRPRWRWLARGVVATWPQSSRD